MFIDSLKVGGKEEHLLARIYKSSILLTAVLSIADNVAASENRKYCGKVQVREVQQIEILHGFIRYLLDRELNREKITKTFRKALGINWVSSKT